MKSLVKWPLDDFAASTFLCSEISKIVFLVSTECLHLHITLLSIVLISLTKLHYSFYIVHSYMLGFCNHKNVLQE